MSASPPPAPAAAPAGGGGLVAAFDRLLAALACVAMVAAFVSVALGVLARLAAWDIAGLDAYAGYAIAAALFLGLPQTLRRQEHIRVTLLLERVGPRWRALLEWWGLVAGLGLATYLAWYAVRLVLSSHDMHDVSQSLDATPLWIPQLAMALGCTGFAVSMADALWSRLRRRAYFIERPAEEASHVE